MFLCLLCMLETFSKTSLQFQITGTIGDDAELYARGKKLKRNSNLHKN